MNLTTLRNGSLLGLVAALAVAPQLAMGAEAKAKAAPSAADAFSLSGSVAFTSDYRFRGVTQNDENPTPQVGLELDHDSGAYAGIWGSPVDFNDGDEAKTELDLSLGYRYETGPWKADARYTYYAYPGADSALNYDYSEVSFEGAYDLGAVTLGGFLAYSPNFFADSGHAEYVQAKLTAPLPHNFSAHAYLGKQFVADNDAFGYPDTVDWNIGAGYTFKQVNLDLSYIDTDMTSDECAAGCSGRVVGTVSYNF